ncbi:MAG: 3-hydroxylacyl-ACP dehydratase [Planctomycetota bacterium]
MTASDSPEAAPRAWTLADVLPQKPPMVLLDSIVSHAADETVCSVRIDPTSPFAGADGSIPCWIALEYMAQCAAAHSGLLTREQGKPIRMGFLLGSKKITFHVQHFEAGSELRVTARSAWSDGELASFACTVHASDGKLLAECDLTAYSPHDMQNLQARQNA